MPRQRALIREGVQKLESFQKLIEKESDIGILSSELNLMGRLVEELFGTVSPDEVLESVFSRFCIGK